MILITGGMGFIGLHTARALLDAGEEIVLTQFKVRREPDFIKDALASRRAVVEQLDASDPEAIGALVRRYPLTGIVHLVVPGLGAFGPADDYRVNMIGLLGILQAAEEAKVMRLTVASSIGVYAGVPAGPFREDMPLPIPSGNPTEAFKKAFEILSLHYADRAGMDAVMLRIGGIWGPLYHSMANIPSRLAHAAVAGRPADFTGARGGVPHEDDGSDMCYVKDCADGIVRLQLADRLNHRIYNIGNGALTTYGQVARAVCKVVPEARLELQPGSGPRAKPHNYMDIRRIYEDTGYAPRFTVDAAVADYIEWLRHHPQ